ncbi:hypothetical protein HY214_03200 [Candidatus Roizmanbacteria bacterium]|nr:hypothetical protein [Candidatus Roizmanbacteria bacterium]
MDKKLHQSAELNNRPDQFTPQIMSDLSLFYEELGKTSYALTTPNTELLIRDVASRASALLVENNLAASTHSRELNYLAGEYKTLLRGGCAVGAFICVDGRIPFPQLFFRLVTVWESQAGLPEIEQLPFQEQPSLVADRVAEAIQSRAQTGELLEILFAHRSNDPKHSCGAMAAMNTAGLLEPYLTTIRATRSNGSVTTPDADEIVLANLAMLEERGEAITSLYNRAPKLKKELKRVAISAVYNTDDMSIELSYGTKNFLSTKSLTNKLVLANLVRHLTDTAELDDLTEIGSMKNTYTDPAKQLDLENALFIATKNILTFNPFSAALEDHFDKDPALRELTADQRQALSLVIARNVAFQYLTGLFTEDNPDHHFVNHDEQAISVSHDGANIGQFNPNTQFFSTAAVNTSNAVEHILLEAGLMSRNPNGRKPHIVFLAISAPSDKDDRNREAMRANLRHQYRELLSHPKILELVSAGEVVVIPVEVNGKTREANLPPPTYLN